MPSHLLSNRLSTSCESVTEYFILQRYQTQVDAQTNLQFLKSLPALRMNGRLLCS